MVKCRDRGHFRTAWLPKGGLLAEMMNFVTSGCRPDNQAGRRNGEFDK
jgi:hypothetical protein